MSLVIHQFFSQLQSQPLYGVFGNLSFVACTDHRAAFARQTSLEAAAAAFGFLVVSDNHFLPRVLFRVRFAAGSEPLPAKQVDVESEGSLF